jgi:hypothetical protein
MHESIELAQQDLKKAEELLQSLERIIGVLYE